MFARRGIRLLVVLLAASGCAASIVGGVDATRVQTGSWGGEHVALTVSESGAHLEFDCASGEITEPLTLDSDRRLGVDGVFIQEHGGPIRSDETPDRKPARYSGRIEGQTLTLDVTLIDSQEKIGVFTLIHGEEPRIRQCR